MNYTERDKEKFVESVIATAKHNDVPDDVILNNFGKCIEAYMEVQDRLYKKLETMSAEEFREFMQKEKVDSQVSLYDAMQLF